MQSQLEEGEALMASLDDIYTVSMPERVHEVHTLLAGGGDPRAPEENPSVESGW